MEGLPDSAWIFAGSVIAALIVLFSGWLQQTITRASTVSGYRQKWIQDVRNAFSKYMYELEKLSDLASDNNQFELCFGARSTILIDTREIRKLRNYLRLYTNPGEKGHLDLLEHAKSIESYLIDTARKNLKMNEYEYRRDELGREFQGIIKEEWDRVKMGELKWWGRKQFQGIGLFFRKRKLFWEPKSYPNVSFVLCLVSICISIMGFYSDLVLGMDKMDLFARSGALLVLSGAGLEYQLSVGQTLRRRYEEGSMISVTDIASLLNPTIYERRYRPFAHLMVILGTLIWGLGDLVFKFL